MLGPTVTSNRGDTSSWVEPSDLMCPGCRERVIDAGDGFTHRDGSALCWGTELVELGGQR